SDGDTPATSGAKPAGKYTFAKAAELPGAVRDSDCEEHSYNKVKTFFKDHRCVSLTRQLFTADVNGHKVYSSVSVVQMANAADAQALKALTEQDGTGNVTVAHPAPADTVIWPPKWGWSAESYTNGDTVTDRSVDTA
ncbi:hypothetical protein ACFQ1S_39130, partial [Kibdelosporangium lantanae]